MKTCRLAFDVNYKEDVTDPESLVSAFDRLLETAMSTPGILEEYGDPTIAPTTVLTIHEGQYVVMVHRHDHGHSAYNGLWQGSPIQDATFFDPEAEDAESLIPPEYLPILAAMNFDLDHFEPEKDEELTFFVLLDMPVLGEPPEAG